MIFYTIAAVLETWLLCSCRSFLFFKVIVLQKLMESLTLNCCYLNGVLIFHAWDPGRELHSKVGFYLMALTSAGSDPADFISLPDSCTIQFSSEILEHWQADACKLAQHEHTRAKTKTSQPLTLSTFCRHWMFFIRFSCPRTSLIYSSTFRPSLPFPRCLRSPSRPRLCWLRSDLMRMGGRPESLYWSF